MAKNLFMFRVASEIIIICSFAFGALSVWTRMENVYASAGVCASGMS